jgi:hypothetical protein
VTVSSSRELNSPWRIEPDGLHLGGLLRVSFQRCLRPAHGIHRAPPRSLGALPIGRNAEGELLVPMALNEAIWLGVSTLGDSAYLLVGAATEKHGLVNVRSGRPLAEDGASHFSVSGPSAIQGIFRDSTTWWAFQRAPAEKAAVCHWLFLGPSSAPPSGRNAAPFFQDGIHLVDYDDFSRATGLEAPKPIDPADGYGGWLLP